MPVPLVYLWKYLFSSLVLVFASGESKVAKMLFLVTLHSCISLIIYSLSTDKWSVVLGIEDHSENQAESLHSVERYGD